MALVFRQLREIDENDGRATIALATEPCCGIRDAETSKQPTAPEQRLVGLAYSVAFPPVSWDKIWGIPRLQPYRSDNPAFIRQHAVTFKYHARKGKLLNLVRGIASFTAADLVALY